MTRVSAIGVIGVILAASACSHPSSATPGLLPLSIQSKLDPELLLRLEELGKVGRLDEKLSVLIRTVSEIKSDQEQLLQEKGVIINSKLGVILSAVVPARSIQEVAALEFVLRIEMTKKLRPLSKP